MSGTAEGWPCLTQFVAAAASDPISMEHFRLPDAVTRLIGKSPKTCGVIWAKWHTCVRPDGHSDGYCTCSCGERMLPGAAATDHADLLTDQRDAARAEVAALRARQDADLDRVCEAAFDHAFEAEDWETAPEYIRERWRKALRAALQGGTA